MGVGNEIINMVSDEITNNYNSLKLEYTTPTIKGFNFNDVANKCLDIWYVRVDIS
jgi:hypothetical protein